MHLPGSYRASRKIEKDVVNDALLLNYRKEEFMLPRFDQYSIDTYPLAWRSSKQPTVGYIGWCTNQGL